MERYKAQFEAEAVETPSESSSVRDLLQRISVLEKVCLPAMTMLIGSKTRYLMTNFLPSSLRSTKPTDKVRRRLSIWSNTRISLHGYRPRKQKLNRNTFRL